MKKRKSKISRYKSDIIKKRKQRLWNKVEKALDEFEQAIELEDQKIKK